MALDAKEIFDKAMKLPLAARAGILAGIYVLIVVLYYFGFYTEAQVELEKKTKAYETIHAKLVQTQNVASQIDTFIEEVNQLKEKLDRAQDQLPPEARMDVLIEQITRIGKDNGLQFTRITPKAETPKGFYSEIPIEFEMMGRYHSFGLFFQEMAGQSRIMNVQNLSLKRESDKTSNLKAAFTVTTYRSVEKASGAAAGAEGAAAQGQGAGARGAQRLKGGGAKAAEGIH